MRKSILTLFVLTILSSCVTQQRCLDKFPPQTVTVIKDSIVCVPDSILIPGKTVTMESTSPCPPQVVFHSEIKKNGLTSVVDIRNGILTQTCHDDSLMREIQRRDHYISTLKQMVLPAKEVHVSKWYDKPSYFLAICMLIVITAQVAKKKKKKGKV